MSYSPTQEDIQLIRQQEKVVFVKVELLNKNFKTLEKLEGNLVSDNLSVDSESKQRRSYTCDLVVTDASFLIGNDKKIWIDKYLRVYYGVQSARTKEILWYKLGTFTYINASYSYNATDNTLSLTCADMMADYDGTKNGQELGASTLTIPAGEDIRTTIIQQVKEAGIKNYYIEDIGKEVPYDLEFNDAVTYCDVWTKLCELYDSWEFFFDIDGTFIWRKIPTGISEPVIMDDTILKQIVISEKLDVDFSTIYNVTEVWGKLLELENEDRYADSSTYENNIYSVQLEGIESWEDVDHLDRFGIRICADCEDSAKFSVNGLEAIPIIRDDGSLISAGDLLEDTVYVFMYRRNMNDTIQNCLYLMGQYQAYGIYKETNPECPYSVTSLGYEIPQKVSYDELYSDDLCYNQAEYLTYQTTAMQDTITLETLVIPWLEVNQKISYTPNASGETNQYMIKNLSWSTSDGTMSITLYKFLESFEYVYQKKQEQLKMMEEIAHGL